MPTQAEAPEKSTGQNLDGMPSTSAFFWAKMEKSDGKGDKKSADPLRPRQILL